ncbi:hypothetical protein ELQ94_08420 [Labedella endophytica]|uniref:PKD domain-containing protein n=1 Tax=Labedella endophytica TaxID=1523160 RepID=A0A3S0XNN1_9MICO|nr:hypothetical protein ELQ94_08420 [Labedella endophytica]
MSTSSASARVCSDAEKRLGICPTGSTESGSGVDIGATEQGPGGGSGGSGGGDGAPTDSGQGSGGSGISPGTSAPSTDGSGLGGNPRRIITDLDPCPDCSEADPPADAPAITLSDLASFSPSRPTFRMEPNGWMLRGLPANFIADPRDETTGGTLLGRPIDVRFTPVSYTWTWGDGTADTVTEPGRTWEELRLPRFSETPTSHVYTERGTMTVGLDVAYAVAFRFDGGDWVTVDGSVSAQTTLDAYVGSAQTVLVPGDCRADPVAIGC